MRETSLGCRLNSEREIRVTGTAEPTVAASERRLPRRDFDFLFARIILMLKCPSPFFSSPIQSPDHDKASWNNQRKLLDVDRLLLHEFFGRKDEKDWEHEQVPIERSDMSADVAGRGKIEKESFFHSFRQTSNCVMGRAKRREESRSFPRWNGRGEIVPSCSWLSISSCTN